METKFKCKDEVLYRLKNPEDSFHYWTYGIFSHYQPGYKGEMMASINGSLRFLKDCDIIPYKGNEALVGTIDDTPGVEVTLADGTYVMVIHSLVSPIRLQDWKLQQWFKHEAGWSIMVPLSDFDPSDWEKTKKKAVYYKKGKLYKYS